MTALCRPSFHALELWELSHLRPERHSSERDVALTTHVLFIIYVSKGEDLLRELQVLLIRVPCSNLLFNSRTFFLCDGIVGLQDAPSLFHICGNQWSFYVICPDYTFDHVFSFLIG